MTINKKITATMGLLSVVVLLAETSMAPANEYKNLKVLPKNISHENLGKVMGKWSQSLGVRCNFCHVRDTVANAMNFVSDAKPEKKMARHMYQMMSKINQKYFEGKKDSLGMMSETAVSCVTCHRGTSHPEVSLPVPAARK